MEFIKASTRFYAKNKVRISFGKPTTFINFQVQNKIPVCFNMKMYSHWPIIGKNVLDPFLKMKKKNP